MTGVQNARHLPYSFALLSADVLLPHHCADEDMEAQRGQVTCPKSPSNWIAM